MRVGAALTAVASVTVLAAASPAVAAPSPVHPVGDALTVAEQGCIEGAELANAVSSSLARPDIDARLNVVVHNRDPHHASFTILRDGAVVGERTLGGDDLDCAQLAAVVGLALATAIEATLASPRSPSPPPGPAGEPRPAAPAPGEAPRNGPGERSAFAPLSVSAEGLVLVGVLPVAVPGAELGVGYRLLRWFEPRASVLASGRESFVLGDGATEANLLAGRAEACFVASGEVLAARACGGVAIGAMWANGAGLASNYDTMQPWGAASARLSGDAAILGPLAVRVSADAFVPFLAPRFETLSPGGTTVAARELPAVGVALGAGALVSFP